ncbi:MAG: transposase [Acidobacteriaceae bacterium]
MGKCTKTGSLTDVSDEEWSFVLPYLLLSRVDSASREHDPRAILNAVRYVVKGGNQWRLMPNDLPPWPVAYPQMQEVTGSTVELAHVDQGYTGDNAATAAGSVSAWVLAVFMDECQSYVFT